MTATVLTSATLSVDGRFDYVRGRLGDRGGARGTAALGVRLHAAGDSLSAAPRCPIRGRRDFAAAAGREVIEILKRTARPRLRAVHQLRQPPLVHQLAAAALDYPILVQGTAPRSALLREFKATPQRGAVRDVELLAGGRRGRRGAELRHHRQTAVRVPRAIRSRRARIDAINADGGNAFADYQIPLAILALQQGLGRLIRHRQDRGVLAVLDPRLRTMGYGRRFLASLPTAPVTHDLASLDKFFEHG